MITFQAYNGEAIIITNYQNGFWLSNNRYISIKALTFSGTFSGTWGRIDNGSDHNEIAYNAFTSKVGGLTVLVTGASNQKWVTHNWIHNNTFNVSGTGCTDGGHDTVLIGVAQGAYGNPADNDNNNTVENNTFNHAQHANWDNYGLYSVFRNNIVHNEPWSKGCMAWQAGTSSSSVTIGTGRRRFSTTSNPGGTVTVVAASDYSNWMSGTTISYSGGVLTLDITHLQGSGTFNSWILSTKQPPIYSNANPNYSALNGNYGHRNFQITEDYNRTQTFVLVEGNRSGFAGVNQMNDGADGFSLAAPSNIVRYNFFYGAMNPGLMFKYNWISGLNSGGHGGTYNRVYNNTFYNNGIGYSWASHYPVPCAMATCPWPQGNVSLYSGPVDGTTANCGVQFNKCSGLGNVMKNNLMYLSSGHSLRGWDVEDKGSPSNGIPEIFDFENNWVSGPQTSSCKDYGGHNNGCTGMGNPKFNNPDLSNFNSTTLPDLGLKSSSKAIDGGTYLTTATNSGSTSKTLTAADAMYFQDGSWGSDLSRPAAGLGGTMQADWIAIGAVTNIAQISSVSYGSVTVPTGTIDLARPMTWKKGDPIWLYKKSDGTRVLFGRAPDYGASEFTQ